MIFFMETKVDKKRMAMIRCRWGFVNGIYVPVKVTCEGLCLAWKDSDVVNLM